MEHSIHPCAHVQRVPYYFFSELAPIIGTDNRTLLRHLRYHKMNVWKVGTEYLLNRIQLQHFINLAANTRKPGSNFNKKIAPLIIKRKEKDDTLIVEYLQ